jgi:3-oxoacyl-[acyl-carrier protein] reductase
MGREAVQRLASLGYAVVVNYVHDQRTAESTVETVLEHRGAAVAIRADVSDDLDVERLFGQTIETFGSVDAVVHTVRGHVDPTALTELAVGDFDEICRMTIRAAFVVDRIAADRLRSGGAIVNLLCSADASASPRYGAYATTSAAAEALIRLLAIELRGRDITVNGLAVAVDSTGAPTGFADAVAHLLGDEGRGTTGQVIDLDENTHGTSGHTGATGSPAAETRPRIK